MFLHDFLFSSMLDSLTEGPLSTSSVVCSFLQLQSTIAPRKPATSSNCNFQRGDWILLTFPHTSPPSEMVNGESHGHKRSYAMMSGMNDGLCAEAEIIGTSSFPDFSFEVKITGLAVDVPCISLRHPWFHDHPCWCLLCFSFLSHSLRKARNNVWTCHAVSWNGSCRSCITLPLAMHCHGDM